MIKLRMYKVLLTLIVSLLLYYSFIFSPRDLEINHYNRSYNNKKNQIKIAQISDLHITSFGVIEKKVLRALEQEKPDLVVITGDISSSRGNIDSYELFLSRIKSKLGTFFVNGNWEYWEPIEGLEELLKRNHIVYLNNKIQKVDSNLFIVGFDDIEGEPDTSIIERLSSNSLNIGLFHSPTFFNQIPKNIQLSLAGHSHGGQIKIPFLGPLWFPAGVDNYIEGWYKRENIELYVNRGIGNSILPIRFNCRPELTIFNIEY
ncbi:MAG: metallophosphoesterase [Oligoflexia bacterium]|nr:metallophosphoesterase [Oligoflexia bacterium]